MEKKILIIGSISFIIILVLVLYFSGIINVSSSTSSTTEPSATSSTTSASTSATTLSTTSTSSASTSPSSTSTSSTTSPSSTSTSSTSSTTEPSTSATTSSTTSPSSTTQSTTVAADSSLVGVWYIYESEKIIPWLYDPTKMMKVTVNLLNGKYTGTGYYLSNPSNSVTCYLTRSSNNVTCQFSTSSAVYSGEMSSDQKTAVVSLSVVFYSLYRTNPAPSVIPNASDLSGEWYLYDADKGLTLSSFDKTNVRKLIIQTNTYGIYGTGNALTFANGEWTTSTTITPKVFTYNSASSTVTCRDETDTMIQNGTVSSDKQTIEFTDGIKFKMYRYNPYPGFNLLGVWYFYPTDPIPNYATFMSSGLYRKYFVIRKSGLYYGLRKEISDTTLDSTTSIDTYTDLVSFTYNESTNTATINIGNLFTYQGTATKTEDGSDIRLIKMAVDGNLMRCTMSRDDLTPAPPPTPTPAPTSASDPYIGSYSVTDGVFDIMESIESCVVSKPNGNYLVTIITRNSFSGLKIYTFPLSISGNTFSIDIANSQPPFENGKSEFMYKPSSPSISEVDGKKVFTFSYVFIQGFPLSTATLTHL